MTINVKEVSSTVKGNKWHGATMIRLTFAY
jgi:hypothetical protein